MTMHRIPFLALLLNSLTLGLDFAGGTGTTDDPYQIATAEQLLALGNDTDLLKKCYILMDDIDLDPNLPGRMVFDSAVIASEKSYFSGTFDGNGHAIRNLTISNGLDNLGLFGETSGAIVRNLGLEEVWIHGHGDRLGGLAGDAGRGIISGCYCTGAVDGVTNIGGLVGTSRGEISNCYSQCSVVGVDNTGGLVGNNRDVILSSHSHSTVNGMDNVGGLAGESSEGVVLGSYSEGSVTGRENIGGLAGKGHHVFSCYSGCQVRGDISIGGLLGKNEGLLACSYSRSPVWGGSTAGGLVGTNQGTVESCYSSGAVAGDSPLGGLVGKNTGGTVTRSFWDRETTGLNFSDGGTGLTTEDMRKAETYLAAGWDLAEESVNGTTEVWWIPDTNDYPLLSILSSYEPVLPEGTGNAENPYIVSTAQELGAIWFRPHACYHLANNLDVSPSRWRTSVIPYFGGEFMGNDHAIENLRIQGETLLGLVGITGSGAWIDSLGLVNVQIEGSGNRIGSLAAINRGIISDSFTTGAVEGRITVGGLVGTNEGTIAESHSEVTVKGLSQVGGLAGKNHDQITRSHSIGDIQGSTAVGGLLGLNFAHGEQTVVRCYHSGHVSGLTDVGGLVGENLGGAVQYCFSTGTVNGNDSVGGLVGRNTRHAGGPINCFSNASVTGEDSVGGLVGTNAESIQYCHSVGPVRGTSHTGGLVGQNQRAGNASHSFWDIETSGIGTSSGGVGLTSTEMRNIQTFLSAGWDYVDEIINGNLETWQTSDETGYPVLSVFHGYKPMKSGGSGTVEDPFLITSAHELACIGFYPRAHYQLTADIDLAPKIWPGAVIDSFGGILDGNGYVIRNLHITGEGNLGFINTLTADAQLSNLGLLDAEITATDKSGYSTGVGTLVAYNDGLINNCRSIGTVISERNRVGGLVGWNYAGRLIDCSSRGAVNGKTSVGGLVGYNDTGSILRSTSSCTVSGRAAVGGLVGDHDGQIIDCYSMGTVTGEYVVGGLVGSLFSAGSVTNSYIAGSVTGDNGQIGGLIGRNLSGHVANSFWDIEISGQLDSAGGTGLPTGEMMALQTFLKAGWNLTETWSICAGSDYPRLQWEGPRCCSTCR